MTPPVQFDRPALAELRDPLSEVARRERRALLGTSVLAVALVKASLLPSEITALGVKPSASDQKALLALLGLVILYFLGAFLLYGSSDLVTWRVSQREALRDTIRRLRFGTEGEREQGIMFEVEREFNQRQGPMYLTSFLVGPVSTLRALFDFALPLLFGAYAAFIALKGAA